jgi:hypothetical protein
MRDNIRRESGSRMGFLTKREKEYVRGRRILNTKTKSKLFKKLTDRLKALNEDFDLIPRNEILGPWRYKNLGNLSYLTNLVQNMSAVTSVMYFDPVMTFKDRKKTQKFYMVSAPNDYDTIRFFEKAKEPAFALRKIKNRISEKPIFGKLVKAVQQNIFHYGKQNALTEQELDQILK